MDKETEAQEVRYFVYSLAGLSDPKSEVFSTTASHLSLPGILLWNDSIRLMFQVSLSFPQLTGQKSPEMLHNEKLEMPSSLLLCVIDKETELRGTTCHVAQPNEYQPKVLKRDLSNGLSGPWA